MNATILCKDIEEETSRNGGLALIARGRRRSSLSFPVPIGCSRRDRQAALESDVQVKLHF